MRESSFNTSWFEWFVSKYTEVDSGVSKTELRALIKAEKVGKMLYFNFTKQVLTRVTAL